jgi:hypothetical protein
VVGGAKLQNYQARGPASQFVVADTKADRSRLKKSNSATMRHPMNRPDQAKSSIFARVDMYGTRTDLATGRRRR